MAKVSFSPVRWEHVCARETFLPEGHVFVLRERERSKQRGTHTYIQMT